MIVARILHGLAAAIASRSPGIGSGLLDEEAMPLELPVGHTQPDTDLAARSPSTALELELVRALVEQVRL